MSDHVVDRFVTDDRMTLGWQCFTCGAEETFPARATTFSELEQAAEKHEITGGAS